MAAEVLPGRARGAGPVYGGFATVVGVFTLLYVLSNVLVLAAEAAAVPARQAVATILRRGPANNGRPAAHALLVREQGRRRP